MRDGKKYRFIVILMDTDFALRVVVLLLNATLEEVTNDLARSKFSHLHKYLTRSTLAYR